jgi:uncharacterized protein YkwD
MRIKIWVLSTLFVLTLSPPTQAQERPGRLSSRIKRVFHPSVAKTVVAAPQAPCSTGSDGFGAILNSQRASAGLSPLVYDPDLSAWASKNNAEQCNRGIGHHLNPQCFQNCAYNHTTSEEVMQGWMNSPGHRRNILNPAATRFGIAYGPGPYWTMNAK